VTDDVTEPDDDDEESECRTFTELPDGKNIDDAQVQPWSACERGIDQSY